MDLPLAVLVHNELLGLKGAEATLLQVSPDGYYLMHRKFGDSLHRVLIPIDQTILILKEPEEAFGETIEVER